MIDANVVGKEEPSLVALFVVERGVFDLLLDRHHRLRVDGPRAVEILRPGDAQRTLDAGIPRLARCGTEELEMQPAVAGADADDGVQVGIGGARDPVREDNLLHFIGGQVPSSQAQVPLGIPEERVLVIAVGNQLMLVESDGIEGDIASRIDFIVQPVDQAVGAAEVAGNAFAAHMEGEVLGERASAIWHLAATGDETLCRKRLVILKILCHLPLTWTTVMG